MEAVQLLVKEYSFERMQIILGKKGRKKSQIVLPIHIPINPAPRIDAFGIFLKPGFSIRCNADLDQYNNKIINLRSNQGYHLEHVYIEYFLECGLFAVSNWADRTDNYETEDILPVPVAIALAQKSGKSIHIDKDLFERIISKEITIKRGRYVFKDQSLPSLKHVTSAELQDLMKAHGKVKDRKNVLLLKLELECRENGNTIAF